MLLIVIWDTDPTTFSIQSRLHDLTIGNLPTMGKYKDWYMIILHCQMVNQFEQVYWSIPRLPVMVPWSKPVRDPVTSWAKRRVKRLLPPQSNPLQKPKSQNQKRQLHPLLLLQWPRSQPHSRSNLHPSIYFRPFKRNQRIQ